MYCMILSEKAPDVTDVSDKQSVFWQPLTVMSMVIHQQCSELDAAAGLALATAVSWEVLLLLLVSKHAIDNTRVDTCS